MFRALICSAVMRRPVGIGMCSLLGVESPVGAATRSVGAAGGVARPNGNVLDAMLLRQREVN